MCTGHVFTDTEISVVGTHIVSGDNSRMNDSKIITTSRYATWFTAGGAIRIAHYDVIDDVITRKP